MATLKQQGNIDWEVPEYQNALKVVIKYEIQTLLERLSQTGEETVVLTANTTDLCVGHLASEKGKRFLNTNEVGEMKNKFLYYCTVEGVDDESGITVSVLPPNKTSSPARGRGGRGRPRGSVSGRGKRGSSKVQTVVTPNQPVIAGQGQSHGDVGQRLAVPQHVALSDSDPIKKFPNTKGTQSVKCGEKRQQSFTAEEIQDMIVSAESKRRKIDSEKHSHSPMKQIFNRLDKGKVTTQNVDKLPQNKQHVLLSEAESSDYYGNPGHHDQRSSQDDSALGIKKTPHFTQENLEFQKFLQQYNEEVSKKFVVEDSDYDEEDYEEEMEGYELMGNKLEKGEIPQSVHFDNRASLGSDQILTSTSQDTAGPSQFQRQFQNFQKNNQVFQNPQTVKGQGQTVKCQGQTVNLGQSQTTQGASEFDPNFEIKEEVEMEGYEDNIHTTSAVTDKESKSGQNKPQISLQSIIKNATQKLADQTEKSQGDASEAIPDIKEESDPHDLEYKQSADSSTSGLKQQADSSNQHIDKSPHQSDVLPDSTQQIRGPRVASPRPVTSSERTKTEDFSEADVSAKLEMLSAKMSWVVEYPKNFTPSQQQQQQQPVNFPQEEEEEEEEYPEGFEGNEETYDDEEEELDESDLRQLAAMKQFRASQGQFPASRGQFPASQGQFPANQGQFHGPHPGHNTRMGGHFDEFDDEDYDEEEMEHLGEEEEDFDDEEYGELDSEDEQTLREMGHLPPRGTPAHGMLGRMLPGNLKLPLPGGTGQQNFLNKGQISQDIDDEDGVFPKMTTSDMENFLLMGAMAKCLVCNKLVRRNDIVQHNIMHIQEDEAEEDEEEIDGIHEGVDDMDGEMHEMHTDMSEIHGDLGEMNEEAEEMQDLPEDMQEMHENVLEPIDEELSEETHGGMVGQMQGEGEIQDEMRDVGEHVDFDAEEEGGETHETELTAERVPIDQLPPNTCQICMKSFKNKTGLFKHVKIHDPKDIQCDLCNKTFRLDSYLAKHRKKMHPNARNIAVPQGKEMAEGFSCEVCKQNLPSQHKLEQHMATHE